ncbi:GrpB family protein [Williamsia sterculiae]|uniref:GrpB domain, predicted nucleotidyltransferase, UPF0157 family n=1 Tax=Williamsia sterculiae TaxID=1344003 RepID=A0A1N7EKT0_9NOCA|nr:GrpB family protein [Williamsia sterculiae]SIR88555.1 GrpB domain, predicted nucleotidyltransferase, UPF0157 family [Williamsia sterculiae]
MSNAESQSRPVPVWATESVQLTAWNPRWEQRAADFTAEVQRLLRGWLVGEIDHVGSTAVPGLIAKPVIDLQAPSTHPEAALDQSRTALEAADWFVVPRELDRRPWRWFVVRTDRERRRRLAHVHLMLPGEPRMQQQMRFRDRLRVDHDLAGRYATVEQELARRHPTDREAYTRAKTAFVDTVVGQPSDDSV